jgi:hypothetical protein
VNSLALLLAGLSVCLAIAMWIALVVARGTRHALLRDRRREAGAASEALARYLRGGDLETLQRRFAQAAAPDLVPLVSHALPGLTSGQRADVERVLADRGIFDMIRASFRKSDEGTRILYCELLEEVGDARSAPVLHKALADPAPAVRIAAAIALASRGELPRLRPVLRQLGSKARASSRMITLFLRLLPEQAEEVEALALDTTVPPRLRVSAFLALERGQPGRHLRLLPALAADPAPLVAAAVARALGAHGALPASEILPALLSHPDPLVRREAAAAAGRTGQADIAPILTRLGGDPDPLVASAAARSAWLLARRPDPAPERALLRLPRAVRA